MRRKASFLLGDSMDYRAKIRITPKVSTSRQQHLVEWGMIAVLGAEVIRLH